MARRERLDALEEVRPHGPLRSRDRAGSSVRHGTGEGHLPMCGSGSGGGGSAQASLTSPSQIALMRSGGTTICWMKPEIWLSAAKRLHSFTFIESDSSCRYLICALIRRYLICAKAVARSIASRPQSTRSATSHRTPRNCCRSCTTAAHSHAGRPKSCTPNALLATLAPTTREERGGEERDRERERERERGREGRGSKGEGRNVRGGGTFCAESLERRRASPRGSRSSEARSSRRPLRR